MIELDAMCPDPDLVCSLVGKMVDPDQTCRAYPIEEVIDLMPVRLSVRNLNLRHAVPLLLPSPNSRKLYPYSSLVFVDLAKEQTSSHD